MRRFLLTVLALAVPRVALACTVCFGQSDSPMAWGTKMGVFFMLGVTVSVLAAFAGFFIYLMRRAKLAAGQERSEDASLYVLREEGPVLHASESQFFASDPAQRDDPMVNWLGLPVQASAHAAELDQMTALVHWLMLVLFVGWGSFFVFVLVRFRKGANPTASYAGAKGKLAKSTEVLVAIIEIVLLVFYAIPAWATRVGPLPGENEAFVVRVVAEQFAWNVQYPGRDGKFGRVDIKLVSADNPLGLDRTDPNAKDDITTINQLNLPVDRPVLVHLSSKDVIHSFGLDEMRVKQDAIPGMDIPVWFIPNRPGAYEISCSQLCGLGHYRMRGFLTVQSQSDFQAWMADQEKELATERAR